MRKEAVTCRAGDRNEDANDIILGQPARNLMAHAGGKMDERFRNQVSNAYPRRLKTKLPSTGTIQFEPDLSQAHH
jgi:hypothetical protein